MTNSAAVAAHSFFPFLSYVKTVPRYRAGEHKVINKDRLICYASHIDSLVYSYYAAQLSQLLEIEYQESETDKAVLAYRALGKNNIDFAAEVVAQISARTTCVVKAFDIQGFFDHIDHRILKGAWSKLLGTVMLPPDHLSVFRSITRFARVDREELYIALKIKEVPASNRRLCTAKEFRSTVRGHGLIAVNRDRFGIPQGSPISAVLSNLYLLDFDRQMVRLASDIGGVYRRYSDDILWICPDESEELVEQAVSTAIKARRLEINCDKTETAVFEALEAGGHRVNRPMQYLGFTFDGERVLIRSQTLARYYRRVHSRINRAKRHATKSTRDKRVFRRALYENFTHLGMSRPRSGHRNFITGYAAQAVSKFKSESMRRQIGRHWRNIHKWLPDDH